MPVDKAYTRAAALCGARGLIGRIPALYTQCGAPLLSEVDPLQEGLDPHPNLRGIVVIATG